MNLPFVMGGQHTPNTHSEYVLLQKDVHKDRESETDA